MEGVIMANTRLKSRVRNAARNSKNRPLLNRNHSINNHHKTNQRHSVVSRSNSLKNTTNNHNNKHYNNNINKNLNNGNKIIITDNNDDNVDDGNGNEMKIICAGDFTREVYNAICPRLGHTLHIPEDSVQALFNDMHLYPSKSQVSEMLQCARQCGRRNGASKYLTFGEFCVFVREMQQNKIQQCKTNNMCGNNCEVFLGGSCNPTTWRMDTAIPELQKHGITYYNPQVTMWAPELMAREHDAKQSASVLLFVIDKETRSTGGMIEVAFLVSSGRCVVLVAHPYTPGQSIMGEPISQREYKDLMEGQTNLLLLVRSRGIKVHSSLPSALQCTANILKNSTNNGISAEEQIVNKLRQLRRVFDKYGGQNGEIKLYSALEAYKDLTNRDLKRNEINEMFEYLNMSDGDIANATVTFDRFCTLMAEFTSDNCTVCTSSSTTTATTTTTSTDGRFFYNFSRKCSLLKIRHFFDILTRPIASTIAWASQSFQRQCSTNNNSCNLLNSHLTNGTTEDVNATIQSQNNKQQEYFYDVFLGGTRNSQLKWRRDIAIPVLKKHGISYYNPAVREKEINGFDDMLDNETNNCTTLDNMIINNVNSTITDEDILNWKLNMDRSKVLLFVITNDTRSLTTMILAAHYIGLGRNVVLCIQKLPENGCTIYNETLTLQAVKDYNRGREYLADLSKRKMVPVFENITEAIQSVIEMCESG